MAPWWVYTIVPPGLFLASVFLSNWMRRHT